MQSEKHITGSNNSKMNIFGSRKSNNTGSNSIRSGVDVTQTKQLRKIALQKKSTLLFIKDNQEGIKGSNSPYARLLKDDIPTPSQMINKRRKTMMTGIQASFLRSKSYKEKRSDNISKCNILIIQNLFALYSWNKKSKIYKILNIICLIK